MRVVLDVADKLGDDARHQMMGARAMGTSTSVTVILPDSVVEREAR